MRNVVRTLGVIGLCLVGTSCVSYTGVARSPEGQLYISGGTNYFVYTSPWVRRCDVDGDKLNCVELSEPPSTKKTDAGDAPSTSDAASDIEAGDTGHAEGPPEPPARH
jgi:hypothetical protein